MNHQHGFELDAIPTAGAIPDMRLDLGAHLLVEKFIEVGVQLTQCLITVSHHLSLVLADHAGASIKPRRVANETSDF